ncbi:DNA modification methylase [Chitinophaga ginsengisegetis]|uniref:Methyltransferase n=1 Tax=Chitinophaga ginsengisegetis TaxID=393003 RepID=A0A1T5P928_9BACT|nr:site-specific DNA-methyltransferase [Chitinophaga ginsengisegetis]SKD09083.1 DNA modification methylase [Chitinophaga ginsengisegetis]
MDKLLKGQKNPKKKLISDKRNYLVKTVAQAKEISGDWLRTIDLLQAVGMGLPEVDDRYHIWRVPLTNKKSKDRIGEVAINAYTTEIISAKTTKQEMLEARLLGKDEIKISKKKSTKNLEYPISNLRNTIGLGDSSALLDDMPTASVDLVFTSPPYFNARPEYSDYEVYEEYLLKMRQIIRKCHRVLNEGRFFVINVSHVLLRRASRNEASRRIAVPFDLHRIFTEEGYEFIDDIIWVKPEGAGWATGRGRRFAADRNPLQYKAVPVTEYVLVYRKKTDLLIDWFIRNHPDREIVHESKVDDNYEKTNIWKIQPKTVSKHPAPFPNALAEKVIQYYSFKNDVVLDPFAGSGTTGAAAAKLKRRFVLFEINPEYINLIKKDVPQWLGKEAEQILWLNTLPSNNTQLLF